jgi:hypothetical protein
MADLGLSAYVCVGYLIDDRSKERYAKLVFALSIPHG